MKRNVISLAVVLFIYGGTAMGQWNQVTTGLTSDKIVSLAIKSNGLKPA